MVGKGRTKKNRLGFGRSESTKVLDRSSYTSVGIKNAPKSCRNFPERCFTCLKILGTLREVMVGMSSITVVV